MRWQVAVLGLVAACKFMPASSGVGKDAPPGDGDDAPILDDAPKDAPPDAPPDAKVYLDARPDTSLAPVCSTAGLICPNGSQPKLVPPTCYVAASTSDCWVGCTNGG